jgi:Divergent InlB B-repeat domain
MSDGDRLGPSGRSPFLGTSAGLIENQYCISRNECGILLRPRLVRPGMGRITTKGKQGLTGAAWKRSAGSQKERDVRDTAKSSSARPGSTISTRRRTRFGVAPASMAVLALAVAALFLIPVAQAAASGLKVNLAGTGKGTVKNNPLFTPTTPEVECSGPPKTGVCESPIGNGGEDNALGAIPAPGSEFTGWTIEVGHVFEPEEGESGCDESPTEKNISKIWSENFAGFEGDTGMCLIAPEGGESKLTATFTAVGVKKFPVTIAKTGEGTVTSNPAGIVCTGAKTGAECVSEFEEGSTVEFTASPASGYIFSAWGGCTEHSGLTCKVLVTKATTVKATFVKAPSLTIEKAGSGQGKALATGISCDENCSKASSAVKTGTVVTVKPTPAKGSEAAVFEGGTGSASGCSGAVCTFTISENSSVKVKFNAAPTKTLTVKLTGPAAYKGKVSGKGTAKGLTLSAINCGAGCTTQTESFFASDTVTLTAAAGTGYTFAGWSGGGCSGTGNCAVTMSSDQTVSAEFE